MIAFAVIIVTLTFVVFAYLEHFEQKSEGYEISSKKLGEMYILNKIITSKNCISTGETGILNETLLDDANGGGELECAYLPDFGHYVKVDDLSDGVGWNWEFGYRRESRIGRYKFFEFPITIKDGNTAKPGKIRLGVVSGKDDLIIYLAGQAERAWIKTAPGGIFEKNFIAPETVESFNVEFDGDKICEKNKECKKLLNATVEDIDILKGTNGKCVINYKKVGGELKPTLECSST